MCLLQLTHRSCPDHPQLTTLGMLKLSRLHRLHRLQKMLKKQILFQYTSEVISINKFTEMKVTTTVLTFETYMRVLQLKPTFQYSIQIKLLTLSTLPQIQKTRFVQVLT